MCGAAAWFAAHPTDNKELCAVELVSFSAFACTRQAIVANSQHSPDFLSAGAFAPFRWKRKRLMFEGSPE
jgi:hypothetical protein